MKMNLFIQLYIANAVPKHVALDIFIKINYSFGIFILKKQRFLLKYYITT